jgi:hypothetical protein
MTARSRKDSLIMSRKLMFAAVAALGLAVGGCATSPDRLTAANNPSLYSVHQPVVQRTDFVFDLAASTNGVSVSEQARLDSWFNSIRLRYGDSVTIDEAPGYESPAVRRDIAAVARGRRPPGNGPGRRKPVHRERSGLPKLGAGGNRRNRQHLVQLWLRDQFQSCSHDRQSQ